MRAAAPSPPPSESLASAIPEPDPGWIRRLTAWLAGSRPGLVVMALAVGGAAGLGAVGFRELVFLFTWLFTGHQQFGQQGHAASDHLAFAGIYFVLFVPVIGGLLYGPLIQRFAREARGHGVPEVMLAVAESGGRIRPPVTIVKAFASALCIGTGGSVGREGPIVQIGAALASSLGQLVRMTETRLRVIVACGAAAGIAATFNAPLTGLLFGVEVVLREVTLDAVFATSLAAVTADLVSRAVFGGGPFFSAIPHDLTAATDSTYLLMAALGLIAGLIGYGFKTVLYGLEDRVDELWSGRPEWTRPVVGGVVLGLLLLALPQMYGVGYPVMDQVLAGHELLWFVVILMLGKILAASLTLSIGGSGGVFGPSLFIGAAAGEAFGIIAHHLFGPVVGAPAMYGVVAMGGVFAGSAQAPLTSIASVAEMTGNFTLTLPIMLVSGIAAATSRRLSYGSIYTTKLLRRGIDIERPKATPALRALRVSQIMQPRQGLEGRLLAPEGAGATGGAEDWLSRLGEVRRSAQPQALFEDEDLAQALRQLVQFGPRGLPVLDHEDHQLRGWLTRADVLRQLSREAREPAPWTNGAVRPGTPLVGYRMLEVEVGSRAPGVGQAVEELDWPAGTVPVAFIKEGEVRGLRAGVRLEPGERLIVLAPAPDRADHPPTSVQPPTSTGPAPSAEPPTSTGPAPSAGPPTSAGPATSAGPPTSADAY